MVSSIVAISGPSGSGKTLMAESLRRHFQSEYPTLSLAILAEDAYYHDHSHLEEGERARINFDHPSALDHDLLLSHLQQLRRGQPVQVPIYDYHRHIRSGRYQDQVPAQVLLVEGILLLSNPALRAHFDISVYIETPLEVCLARRIARDTRERGRSEESVRAQFQATVAPMYRQYIAPSSRHAQFVVSGEDSHSNSLPPLAERILAGMPEQPAAPKRNNKV